MLCRAGIRINRTTKLFLLMLTICHLSYSQINLVNNPGFEIPADSCFYGDYRAKYWFQPNSWDLGYAAADFFHENQTCNASYTPPYLFSVEFQYPRTGHGIAAAGVCAAGVNKMREYIEGSLWKGLSAKKKYCTFFYVNKSNFTYASMDCFQLLFSVDTFLFYGEDWAYYHATPHIQNPKGNIIKDTLNWELVKGIYTATGGENFITIGCFAPIAEVDLICSAYAPYCGYAYYYYDDFGVYELPEIEAGEDDSICVEGGSVQLQANCTGCWPGLQYRWWPSNGLNDTTSLSPIASPTQSTTYYFGLIDTSNTVPCIVDHVDSVFIYVCPKSQEPILPPKVPEVPDIITPGGNGLNDFLVIKNLPPHSRLFIYNRWGNQLYDSPDYQQNWNCGQCPDGCYFYIIITQDGNQYKGMITVVNEK